MSNYDSYAYEGNKKYVFVSYSHKDEAEVLEIIEKLTKNGLRVWYDNGINPGSNWPEVIAGHLNNCEVFLSFISKNAVNSHNCRREINYAILKKKSVITAFLEETPLSPGMEMQLSSTQFIDKTKLADEEFFEKILSDSKIKKCIGNPKKDIKLNKFYIPEPKTQAGNLSDGKDFYFFENITFHLIRQSTGEKIRIKPEEFNIGRKSQFCDYAVTDNKTLSRLHATLKIRNGKCIIYDNNSLNGVHINGKLIPPNTETEIIPHDEIRLGSEKFILVADKEETIHN